MQSLYAQGRLFCTGCRRYRTEAECRTGNTGRLYCKCGQQVRTKAKKQSQSEKPESRVR